MKIYLIRIVVNIIVVAILVGCAAAVFFAQTTSDAWVFHIKLFFKLPEITEIQTMSFLASTFLDQTRPKLQLQHDSVVKE